MINTTNSDGLVSHVYPRALQVTIDIRSFKFDPVKQDEFDPVGCIPMDAGVTRKKAYTNYCEQLVKRHFVLFFSPFWFHFAFLCFVCVSQETEGKQQSLKKIISLPKFLLSFE